MDPFLLVVVNIHIRSSNSKSTVQVEPAEIHVETEEVVSSFDNNATKEEVLIRIFNKDVLKACLKQLFSNTNSSRRRKAVDVLFQLLGTTDWYRDYMCQPILSEEKRGDSSSTGKAVQHYEGY